MRRLALLTSDFALYHDLVRFLRERGLPFDSLAFGETPGPQVGAVLTSWRDALGKGLPGTLPIVVVPVAADGREDLATAVAQGLRILEGVPGYHEVVVGIDPGKRPGVALLGDGRLLHTAQLFVPRDVGPLVRGLLTQFPSDRYVLRIGHGAPRERDDILGSLTGFERAEVRIELVDETGTTPRPGRRQRLPPDVAAAVEIARTPGRPTPRPRRFVSRGAIHDVQRESRELSGGRFTISRDLARRVARGDVSLREALTQEEGRLSRNPRSQSSSR